MAPEDRRADDPRISDIQNSVHEIRSDVRSLEKRLDGSDRKISEIERQSIETKAAQAALETIMNSENRRMSEKVDLVHASITDLTLRFSKHSDDEANDRKSILRSLVALLFTVFGTLAWWAFQRLTGQ